MNVVIAVEKKDTMPKTVSRNGVKNAKTVLAMIMMRETALKFAIDVV